MPTILEALQLAERALSAGDRAQAEFISQQILAAVPDEPRALNLLGVLAYEAQDFGKAEGHLRRAMAVHGLEPATLNNLNLVLRAQGRAAEAADCCRQALELAPEVPELHNNLGVALKETGALAESVASFERALARQPDFADAHYNLANALVKLDRLDAAEASYRRALALAPENWDAHNNLGTLLELQAHYDDAMACYERALAIKPDAPEVHRNRAMIRLRAGNFREAWQDYEWRWAMPQFGVPEVPEPAWKGEPLAGRTILVRAEQGIGDMIQFLRFLEPLKRRGARVLFECALKLHALLGTAAGIDRLVPDDRPGEPLDYGIWLLSLPAVFGTTLETIPADAPYLFADPRRVEHWRRELAGETQFKVGIAWQGNPSFTGDFYRSIPLAHYLPLAENSRVRLYSLQKGHGQEQLAPMAETLNAVDLAASLDNDGQTFSDTAAVMQNLDLVIAPDTAMAHLAGALGVPVWVALQQSPNWRWLIDRDDSPWYPSVRLFRQQRLGDWTGVFRQMADELHQLAAAPQPPTTGHN